MKTRLLLAGLAASILLALGLSFVQMRHGDSVTNDAGEASTARIAEPTFGEFRWPDAWRRDPTDEGDERAGVLLRLRRSDPEATFLLRRITGKLEDPFSVHDLARESEMALREGVRDFAMVENRQFTRDGFDIVSIEYMQGQGSETFRARLLVVPTPDRSFYLTFRSPATAYPRIERELGEITDGFFRALRQ